MRVWTRLLARTRTALMCATCAAALCAALPVARATAETLAQAMASAYESNPEIVAERARLRATDETLAQAQSGYRPIIDSEVDIGVQQVDTKPSSANDGTTHPKSYTIALSQSLFSGYRTVSSVSEADANILAARENLRNVEQSLLLDTAAAYMDVIRDQAIVGLRQNNVEVLSRELRATEERFAVGEVTKTDVAQAQARRAGAVSDLDTAKGNLRSSLAVYERIVGHPAAGLRQPPPLTHSLPSSLEEGVQLGLSEHPQVVAAAYLEQAAKHAIGRITADLMPEVRIDAQFQQRFDFSRFADSQEVGVVTGRLIVPLYEGGEVTARIRQAKHERQGRLVDVEQARVVVRAQVVSAWSQLQATRARLQSAKTQVNAADIALSGVREEERVGQRTLLDVLNAEQELLDARVILVTTERDLVVASYTLLAAVGRLTAANLGLGVELHDPEEHYKEVDGKWWGVDIEPEQGYIGTVAGAPYEEQWASQPGESDDEPLPVGDWSVEVELANRK